MDQSRINGLFEINDQASSFLNNLLSLCLLQNPAKLIYMQNLGMKKMSQMTSARKAQCGIQIVTNNEKANFH